MTYKSAGHPKRPGENEQAFLELARRFRESDNPEEAIKLGQELGRMIFGD
ncbi:MAG TPA: hypothetical protein VJW51_10280 [Candidatus Acidoferrales bacterium]|nr:hypothetical protein [Candidatus Acidoferrales bacterium]